MIHPFLKISLALACAQPLMADNIYHYSMDLTAVKDDKVVVTLTPPDLQGDEATFYFPAMVPGTYEVYDFGRFISNLTATGKNGATITVQQIDVNTYKLKPASAIASIRYEVEDSFDAKIDTTKGSVVFEPGGTNIEESKNFVLNTHGFFGYFKGMTTNTFELNIKKPFGFYASTGLSTVKSGDTQDVITVKDYHNLVDAPIMYCKPDTSTIMVGDSKILVSVYSPNHVITSKYIAGTLEDLLYAQSDYLGGTLPVDKYAFLLYFTDQPTLSGNSGALEHSYSSFYVLPEMDSSYIGQTVRDIAAHEFFHIVTPLNIHAEEIGNFDFNNPRMSEHLWLYEGLTEYSAHLVQVKSGLTEIDQFLETMTTKMVNAKDNYNDTVPFTVMSKNVLGKYKKQYANVYEKGALIGMCLDIMLRYQSGGSYGTQNLMADLSKKYGKDKSFRDQDLFSDIEQLTYPEIRKFLDTYVAGNKPLPFKEIFAMVGLNYEAEKKEQRITLGGIDIGLNQETGRLVIVNVSDMDAFGKAMKFKLNDEFYSFNGRKITMDNARELLQDYLGSAQEGNKLTVEVIRKNKKGKEETKELKAKIKKVTVTEYNVLSVNKGAAPKELMARNGWLGIK